MPANLLQSLPDLVAFILTLMVFSYLIGDNPFYRLAVHLFVGATAGYAVLVAWYNVIYPQMLAPILAGVSQGSAILLALPTLLPAVFGLMLCLFLLLKISPATTRLGSVATAFLVGVGSAVAVGGAVTGTLFPQVSAASISLISPTGSPEGLVSNLVLIIGTLATFGFFYYGTQTKPGRIPERHPLAKPVARVGEIFIGAAFGAMYAGALVASLALFTDRVAALWKVIELFIGG